MQDAVIVSTARTPIAKAFRGAFNDLKSPSMAAIALQAAVARAGIDAAEIEDVIMGTAMQGGTASTNLARLSLLAAGLPLSVSGQTIDRQCASGLMAISIAAKQIMVDGMQVTVGAGQEQISLVQNTHMKWTAAEADANVVKMAEHAYMPMLQTAEIVAKRYGISREAQDEYGFLSQQRTAAAQAAGLFEGEIVPVTARKKLVDKETGAVSYQDVTLSQDEGNRPQTVLADLQNLKPVIDGGCITAGNASQLSDGASASVLMSGSLAAQRGIQPLGLYRGIAVAGLAPEEMGIGPVFAVPKLLKQHGLTVDDIGLWELNEAFACQVLYSAQKLGIDPAKLNVNGGAIALGHPLAATGVRLTITVARAMQRDGVKYGISSACVGGGQGIALLLENPGA